MTRYELNNERKGIEIYFGGKPEQSIIDILKVSGWRWHNFKKCWYAKQNEATIELAEKIVKGETLETKKTVATVKTKKVAYGVQISDYITEEEFLAHCKTFYANSRRTKPEIERCIDYAITKYYNNNDKYYNLSKYIRHAIIWKSIGGDVKKFKCNGENIKYSAVWDKLPVIDGLKATDKKYSAMWGYDQTQITTATYYGRAFGLDILITGGYGSGDVLLKRVDKDGRFTDSCKYFSPNRYTEKEIEETNEYVMYHGR